MLIDAGADVNACGGIFHTALQAAAVDGNDETMRVLVDAGADINALGGIYGNALSAAYCEGYYFCTGLLWEREVSNKLRGGRWGTPLGHALSGACQTLITFLIKEHHADPNEQMNASYGSPLHYCVWNERGDSDVLVNLFIDYGADPNGTGPSGLGGYYGTPLNAAVAQGEVEIMKLLLERGADPSIRGNREEWMSLQLPCLHNNQKLLIYSSSTIPMSMLVGGTVPLFKPRPTLVQNHLSGNSCVEVPISRLTGKVDMDMLFNLQRSEFKRMSSASLSSTAPTVADLGTVLQAASIRCSKALVDFLIHKGANVNERGVRYRTALQAACAAGNKEVVLTLLEQKADVKIPGGRYGSALQAACVYGDLNVVRMLVEHGADIDVEGGFYDVVADACALNAHPSILRYLIKEGNIRPGATGRRYGQARSKVQRAAEKTISDAEAESEVAKPRGEMHSNESEDDAEDLQEPFINIESIPQYDASAAPLENSASASSSRNPTANLESNATSSASESTAPDPLPIGKRVRRRLTRKKSNKTNVLEEIKEVDVSADESLSALGWLQVECGYGGDLNGPGR
ncbi:MAG: hypothetical protein Q9184_007241 [Pyrenodesmia sp. 2 TL-2023]